MDERKSEDSKSQPEDRRDRYPRLGRRIASFIALGGVVYLIAVGIVSVLPQVFSPERAELDPSLTCAQGLRDLRGEMLARMGDHVSSGGSEDDAWLRPWIEGWDRRYRGLEGRCEGEDREAWLLVGRMRERVAASLVRFDEEEGALARAADEHLDRR